MGRRIIRHVQHVARRSCAPHNESPISGNSRYKGLAIVKRSLRSRTSRPTRSPKGGASRSAQYAAAPTTNCPSALAGYAASIA